MPVREGPPQPPPYPAEKARGGDCPCHGSHFAPDGSVLNGPAIYPLAEIE